MIRLHGVSIAIAGRPLFQVINAEVADGKILTLMGPSGSGKSTLLSFIGGFLAPDFSASGQIKVNGCDVTALPAYRRGIGILFQDDLLFPHLSVGQNLAFGLTSRIKGRSERRHKISEALDNAGLQGFQDRDPASLSGGQRARVSLLRSLLAEPKALLLDEPFSKLDATLRDEFRTFVYSDVKNRQLPTILVTHDMTDAVTAGGEVIHLEKGEPPGAM